MEPASDGDISPKFQYAIEPPAYVDESTDKFVIWQGKADLTQESSTKSGEAKIILDILPQPAIGFEFDDSPDGKEKSLRQIFEGLVDTVWTKGGTLSCCSTIGNLLVRPTGTTEGKIYGSIEDWASMPSENFTSAKWLIINGPMFFGRPIIRGTAHFLGRYQHQQKDGATVTVDRLFSKDQPDRSTFSFTHVAEIHFSEGQKIDQFEEEAKILCNALSFMGAGWVGLAGPWLYVDNELRRISSKVTKTTRKGGRVSWCPKSVLGVFEQLYPCLLASSQNGERWAAIQTGLHWLVESQLCAGGVEGALVLQQAALESLAWFDIVQTRKFCSDQGFDKLPASDKIRWLTSLYSIPTSIPAHCAELVSYARANPPMNDLLDLLVDVRNALVHGSPKKVKKVLERPQGTDERINLWLLTTGILEQALLAICGYRGVIQRRDISAVWAVEAAKPVPWAS